MDKVKCNESNSERKKHHNKTDGLLLLLLLLRSDSKMKSQWKKKDRVTESRKCIDYSETKPKVAVKTIIFIYGFTKNNKITIE